jgi:hypothetical protein
LRFETAAVPALVTIRSFGQWNKTSELVSVMSDDIQNQLIFAISVIPLYEIAKCRGKSIVKILYPSLVFGSCFRGDFSRGSESRCQVKIRDGATE